MRVEEPVQSPKPLYREISFHNHGKVTEPLTIRQRNSRSAGKGIIVNPSIHDDKEVPHDLPDLIGSDDEGNTEGPRPIGPSLVNHPRYFHWYDSHIPVGDEDR